MRKIKKLFNSMVNKTLLSMLIMSVFLSSISFIIPVFAMKSPRLILDGGIADGDKVEFFDENGVCMGSAQVKVNDEVLIPENNNEFELPLYDDDNIQQAIIILDLEDGYEVQTYVLDGNEEHIPGNNVIGIDILSNDDMFLTINFLEQSHDYGPGDFGPMPIFYYPMLVYFEGITDAVESTFESMVLIPNDWNGGDVYFKAQSCKIGDEVMPNDGNTECDVGTEFEEILNIIGINNMPQINWSVSGSDDHKYLTIEKDFFNYGKTGIHLGNDTVNIMVDLISKDLINVEANAPLRMDYSYGGATIDEAILTNQASGDVSIFFGNEIATLQATGPKVVGITSLTGAKHTLNEDGSVDVSLPPLSEETETLVSITIKLDDDRVVTRKVNIIRTALELSYEGETNTVRAGYVIHKAYLYNNQPHNDDIFDAYLQVIIYRDDVVVKYDQFQIDDEEFVNGLGKDESGAMESFAPGSLVIYDGSIKGANKVSVFLTDGPIDYNSDTLPSIEFGIGSGVLFEWSDSQ